MKRLALLIAIAALSIGAVAMAADPVETGYRTDTILLDPGDAGCGTLVVNADGTYENGYAWQYGGIAPPDYGAFVECYPSQSEVCAAIYDFTQIGNQSGQNMNILVYDHAGGLPGAVRFTQTVTPGSIAFWPSISRHSFSISTDCTTDPWWIGYWANWPDQFAGWYVGADLDGFGGCPYTKIPPNIGYPTGWTHVSLVWGPTQAIGIGAEVIACSIPVIETTWGQIKSLYN